MAWPCAPVSWISAMSPPRGSDSRRSMVTLSMFSHNDPTTSNLSCGRSDATGSDLWLMQSIAIVAVLRLAWMVLE